jgi:hypothetical protein
MVFDIHFFCSFEKMIRKIISISFLLLYLAFLILPSYPLLHYYFFNSSHAYFANTMEKNYSNGDHTKTGDMAYLNALLKSAEDKNAQDKKAQNPPPSTNNEMNNLVYLVTGNFHIALLTPGIPLHFNHYSLTPVERYLKVLIPPPVL